MASGKDFYVYRAERSIEEVILAQGRLLQALVRDVADIYQKLDASDVPGAIREVQKVRLDRKVQEYLDREGKERNQARQKREERKAQKGLA